MPHRPCLDCGTYTPNTRCPEHTRAVEYGRTLNKRGRRPAVSGTERQRRADTVAAHRATYGDWCPGYQVDAHPASDLTADHTVGVASGGSEHGPLSVLCRTCNGRKR